jgi:molybdopterin/thiamine biosynthesis adenylyltransferase
VVDESNLQRQILHGTKDGGRPKLQSATDRLRDLNPSIRIDTYETMLRAPLLCFELQQTTSHLTITVCCLANT